MEFIGYTIGLECNHNSARRQMMAKMVKVEKNRRADGSVELSAVSGHNLGKFRGCKAIVSAEDYENRPFDAYDAAEEAVWALNLCGFTPMAIDAA